MMINFVKKTILLCSIFFALSGNVFALNLEEEIAYYRDIKKPLEEFLDDLNLFRETTLGIIFRTPLKDNSLEDDLLEDDLLKDETLVDFDYKSSHYYANHFMELYGFYAERLYSLLYDGTDDPFFIEDDETLVIRQKIIGAIELIMDELLDYAKIYLKPKKLAKIYKMSQPKFGYEGTLKIVQKIRTFVEKHETIFNRIYVHERDIIIFSKRGNENEPKIVPVLNLPILKYKNIKKSCKQILEQLDEVKLFYEKKLHECLSADDEIESIKKDKKSMFDRFTRKKKEVEPVESRIIVEESNAINTDNEPPIKRRSSSLLKSLSPRSRAQRTQSLKKISVDEIKKRDEEVEVTYIESNVAENKPIKKRSSSILKVLSPRVLTPRTPTPRSPHGDVLNRGSSDSKLSPKKKVPESTPRPKSGDDITMCKRSNSLPHNDSDIISRAEIISNLEKLYLNSDTRTKKSKKDSKKKERKDRKKEKKDKKERKSLAKSVDKIKFSVPYENPFNE
jgi:hypothetical protein